MGLFSVEGIVLGHFDLGEKDRIITFYTKERGKLRAVAVNLKALKSNLAGSLDLFIHSRLEIYKGSSIARIKSCRPLNTFYPLRMDLLRLAAASYAGELVLQFTQEEDGNEGLFLLFLTTLNLLTKKEAQELELILRVFELRSLALLGYFPILDRCLLCQFPLDQLKSLVFSPKEGGILCYDCQKTYRDPSYPLSKGTLKNMEALLRIDYNRLNVIRLTTQAALEMKSILHSFIEYQLEKELRSWRFLEHVLKTLEYG